MKFIVHDWQWQSSTPRTIAAALIGGWCLLVPTAWAENAPGVTDGEIRIGQTQPYSGPAALFEAVGRAEAAYFKMINDQGGVNGPRSC